MALRFFGKLKAFKVKAIALKYIKIIKISKKDTNNFGCSSKAPRRLGSLSLRPWIRTSCSMEHLRSFGLSVANILLVYDHFHLKKIMILFTSFHPSFQKDKDFQNDRNLGDVGQWLVLFRCDALLRRISPANHPAQPAVQLDEKPETFKLAKPNLNHLRKHAHSLIDLQTHWANPRKHSRKKTPQIYISMPYANCKSCARATSAAAIFIASATMNSKITSSKSIKLPLFCKWTFFRGSQLKTSQDPCQWNDMDTANTPNLDWVVRNGRNSVGQWVSLRFQGHGAGCLQQMLSSSQTITKRFSLASAYTQIINHWALI